MTDCYLQPWVCLLPCSRFSEFDGNTRFIFLDPGLLCLQTQVVQIPRPRIKLKLNCHVSEAVVGTLMIYCREQNWQLPEYVGGGGGVNTNK